MPSDHTHIDDWVPDDREHRVVPSESRRKEQRPRGNKLEDDLQSIRMIAFWVTKMTAAQTGPIPAWLVSLENSVNEGLKWHDGL